MHQLQAVLLRMCLGAMLTVVALPLLHLTAFAQELPRFTEALEVHVFNLEVVVRDRQGKPIRDLSREDFEVLANGARVPVSNFARVSRGVLADVTGTPAGEEVPAEEGRKGTVTWGLYVDQRGRTALRSEALRQLRETLGASFAPGDRAMVAAFNGHTLSVAAPIAPANAATIDSLGRLARSAVPMGPLDIRMAALRADIEYAATARSGAAARAVADELFMLLEEETHRTIAAIRAFESFAGTFSGVEGRAVVIYVGPGFNAIPGLQIVDFWRRMFPDLVNRSWAPKPEEKSGLIGIEIEKLSQRIAASRVTCYTVYTGDRHQGLPDVQEAGGFGDDPFRSDRDHWTSMGQARWMAERAGGRLFVINPSLARQLTVVDDEIGNYYLLGFSAASAPGAMIGVRVRVGVDGAQVQHRQSVRRRTADEEAEDEALTLLFEGAAAANPLGIVVSVGEGKRDRGRVLVPVRIEIPARSLTWMPDGAVERASLSFHFAAAGGDGTVLRLESRALPLEMRAAERETWIDEPVRYSVDVPVPRGESRFSVVVEDRFGDVRSRLVERVGSRAR